MDGFLRQSDGEVAGIAAIYTKSSTEDVALIKVGDGINADSFTLAAEPLKIGNQAVLTGYDGCVDMTQEQHEILRGVTELRCYLCNLDTLYDAKQYHVSIVVINNI